VRLLSARYYIY